MCLSYEGLSHPSSYGLTGRRTSILFLSKEPALSSLERAQSTNGVVFDYSLSIGLLWDTSGEPVVTASGVTIVHAAI